MQDPALTSEQVALLRWLAREDLNQYRECHGPVLDSLAAIGFVAVTTSAFDPDYPDKQPRLPWPPPSMRHAVNLTGAARAYIRNHKIDIWQ